MHILFISQYFPPEIGAPAARVSELARHWVEQGHQVTVLTGFPNHPTGVLHSNYRAKWRRFVWRERVDNIEVVRTWLLPLPNRAAYERILNYASYWLSSCLTGIFLTRPDVIIATSPQILVGLTGLWLAKVKRAPFVFEVRDLWPESLAAVGVSNQKSFLYRVIGHIADFLYRCSDHVVVVSPAFRDYLTENRNLDPAKISVVENGVETELFSPERVNGVRRDLGLEGKFVVSYIGTLGMAHGLEAAIETASRLQVDASNIVFLLVGEGAVKEQLHSLVEKRGVTNLLFLGEQARDRIPGIICASDACLVLLRDSEIFKTVIPTKMLEFMSCGRPVILNVDGQARAIVGTAQAGIFADPQDPAALGKAIMQLYSDQELRGQLGQNGRRWIVDHLSRTKTADKYVEVLKGICEKTKFQPRRQRPI